MQALVELVKDNTKEEEGDCAEHLRVLLSL